MRDALRALAAGLLLICFSACLTSCNFADSHLELVDEHQVDLSGLELVTLSNNRGFVLDSPAYLDQDLPQNTLMIQEYEQDVMRSSRSNLDSALPSKAWGIT